MTDSERIELEGHAPWRADVEKTLGKLHDRLSQIEFRAREALGTGEDRGLLGKVSDEVKRHAKIIALVTAGIVGSAGASIQALRTSASEDGASLSRLSTLERDVDRLEQSIRSLWTVTAPRTFRAPGDPQP